MANLPPWRPFLDPIDAHRYWYLFLIPLALLMSMAYKAVRVESMNIYLKQVVIMTVQVVAAMIGLGLVAFLFVEFLLPLLVPLDN